MLYPPPLGVEGGGQWSLANVYSAALQAFALHFQTSNFILIKLVQQRRVPRDQTQTVYVDHSHEAASESGQIYIWRLFCRENRVLWFYPHPLKHVVDDGEAVLPICESVCFSDAVRRFDLVANGGASLTLRYERAPFPTVHRTVWLPWNVFHVMDTVVMKREANDIPSCYLTGLIRPHPLILATPLSTFYKSSPEDSPIVPETQVRMWSTTILFFFFFSDLTERRCFLKS